MNARSIENGISTSTYRQALYQAMSFFLPASFFSELSALGPTWRGGRWTLGGVIFQSLLMVFEPSASLRDRFMGARRFLAKMIFSRKARGKTYQGFVKARRKISGKQRRYIKKHLRDRHRVISREYWSCGGWTAFAVDGSRVEVPRTARNERVLGCAGKKRTGPQLSLTVLYHLGTGLAWSWRIGKGTELERGHLRSMLAELPTEALVVADAGFVGYELFTAMAARGLSFLIRVGANITLLKKLLEVKIRTKGPVVFLWPKNKRNQPPLMLRLILLNKPCQFPVYLLTNVLEEDRLPIRTASILYRMRWGVEVSFRCFKRTLDHHKLRSCSPRQARQELFWAMIGYVLLGLMSVEDRIRKGESPLSLSVAEALRTVRGAMAEERRWRRKGDLRVLLSEAKKDPYVRTGSKTARDWPHKKTETPPGAPKIVLATLDERHDAERIYNAA